MPEKLVNSEVQYRPVATPGGNPPAGELFMYFKADKKLYIKDSAGVETEVNSGGGGDNNVEVLSTTTGIDGKIATTTDLLVVPAGKTAVITRIDIIPTTVTGFSSKAKAGVGIAAGEDDIMSSTNLNGLNSVLKSFGFETEGVFVLGGTGQTIKLGIDSGATATTYTLTVKLIGYIF